MAKRKKRERRRVAKGDRKNLRLWAEGRARALDKGWREERKYLKKVCKEFHAKIDWRTEDHEEPVLREVNPSIPGPEEELLEDEEKARAARVEVLNARIRRWFLYRVRKLRKHQHTSGQDPTKDPYAVLLAKLSGVTAPPKARQAYQQFMHEAYQERVAPRVAAEWEKVLAGSREEAGERTTKEPKGGFRAKIAREVFAELPRTEQVAYGERAKSEAAAAKAAYVQVLKDSPSQIPVDRQKCIDGLGEFAGPILRGISAHTGLHATLIVGGPIPEFGGELRTIHLSHGQNRSAVADHWPQWDKPRFASNVIQFLVEYLGTAYNIDTRPRKKVKSAGKQKRASKAAASSRTAGTAEPTSSSVTRPPTPANLPPSPSQPPNPSARESPPPAASSTLASDRAQSPAAPDGNGWFLSEEERQANIVRNKALLEALVAGKVPEDPALADIMAEVNRGLEPLTQELRALAKNAPAGEPEVVDEGAGKRQRKERATKKSRSDGGGDRRRSRRQGAASISRDSRADLENAPGGSPAPSPRSAAATGSDGGAVLADASNMHGTLRGEEAGGAFPPLSRAAQLAVTSAPAAPPASQPLPTTLPPCPAAAAKWFSDAYAAMTRVELGFNYQALIIAWARMEKASRYEHGPTNLSSKLRPAEVSTWITRGRRGYEPVVRNPAEYAKAWQKWWDSLQPEWRTKDTDGAWSVVSGYGGGGREWGPLYQWGVNGVLSIVASLCFWGRAVVDDSVSRMTWEAAVGDVVWIFEGMATYYEMFKGKF
ncbi:hypothetical protein R3P38DRAFT_2813181 [Favolaschia claudopus]|uniref:Uncharacterized protein n=1 Tax=Favolaschia claudopus TaxID=2862362 RepID=A0AAV9Z678_9AGAR